MPASAVETRVEPQVGGHGAAIEVLAISDDGSAAVSQDSVGGTRLWPTLDGTREPFVLHLAMAQSLSLGREGDDFVVAALDQGGGAELLRIAGTGQVIARASIAPDPHIEALAVAPQGVLAIRADQTLAIFAPDGDLRGRLEAPPRSRITQIATRGDHTLVLFAHDGTTNGRWLAGTSWGAVTPDFQIDPGSVAWLSPNGTRLAIDFEHAAYIIDVATGTIVDNFGSGLPVGFYDDDTLIQNTGSKLAWQQLSNKYGGRRDETEDTSEPVVLGGNVIASAHGAALALHRRDRTVQLGYRLGDVGGMRVTGDHVVVMGAKQQALELDRSLALRAPLDLPDDSRVLTDLVPLDNRFVIATHTLGTNTWWTVAVLDLVNHTTWQTPQIALRRGELRYEPSTRLLELTDSAASYLTPWDPAKQQFETWYRIEGGPQDTYLVDPRANDGIVAVALHPEGPHVEIAEIHGDDLKVGAPIQPRHRYRVDGYAAGVDRRARVYVVDHGSLVVYGHGLEVAHVADIGDLRVVAQPKGDYIALYGDQRIRLYDIHGSLRWQIAAPLAQRITWLDDELVVDFAGGIGKIDAATGALNKRVCGWSFGLSALSSNDVLAGDSICDAPEPAAARARCLRAARGAGRIRCTGAAGAAEGRSDRQGRATRWDDHEGRDHRAGRRGVDLRSHRRRAAMAIARRVAHAVPVPVVAPEQLALSHAGRDLLATILDEAGSVRVMRLGLDGSVRSEVQLRADVGYEQAIALEDGVLVRSADHVLEWFSAAGESRGKLVADPAWRVQAIAARHDRALAVAFDGTKLQLRWLQTYNGRLSWGPTLDLPGTLQADLVALSPSHARLAVVDTKKMLTVYTLGFAATPLGKPIAVNDPSDIGFIDDDRVAAMGSQLAWWQAPAKPSTDPWAVSIPTMPTPSSMQLADGGAVGDGVAVMGFGAALSIVDKSSVHYLGYKEHGVGNLGAAPGSLWVSMSGSHIVWLDDTLAVKREIELRKTENSPWVYATPIGDRHIVRQVPKDGKYAVELVDVDAPDAPVALGTFPNVERIDYLPEANVLGIAEGTKIHRFQLDTERTAVTELPVLKTRGSLVQMRLLDPARSGGLTAMTLGWSSDYDEDYTLTLYREQGAPQKVRPFRGRLVDFDARGNAIVVNGLALEVRHGKDKVTSFKIDSIGTPVGVSPDGARFAVLSGNDVVVLDDKGTEQWRKPLWGAQQLLFTRDGTRVAVRANGGLVLLDAATGERTAMECGWSFALSSLPPQTNAIASAPVCEDPML